MSALSLLRFGRPIREKFAVYFDTVTPTFSEETADRPDNLFISFSEKRQELEEGWLPILADLEFHSALFNACRNDLFEQMTGMIGKALRACGDIATQLRLSTVAALPLYRVVVEAVRNHNACASRSAMERAVSQAARDIFQLLHVDASDFIKDLDPD